MMRVIPARTQRDSPGNNKHRLASEPGMAADKLPAGIGVVAVGSPGALRQLRAGWNAMPKFVGSDRNRWSRAEPDRRSSEAQALWYRPDR